MSFEYYRPQTVEEALMLLSEHTDAKFYAGGSDVLPQLRAEVYDPDALISLEGIDSLKGIKCEGETVTIGAMTTLRDIENSELLKDVLPALPEAARTIASQKIRNLATIGGNLCQKVKCPYFNQSHQTKFMRDTIEPCYKRKGRVCVAAQYEKDLLHIVVDRPGCQAPMPSDMGTALSSLGATLVLRSADGTREILCNEFYMAGAEPRIKKAELLTEVRVPVKKNMGSAYMSYMPSPGVFSVVSAAVSLTFAEDKDVLDTAAVYLGGVDGKPYPAEKPVAYLMEGPLTEERIHAASKLLLDEVNAVNDDVLFKVAKARDIFRKAVTLAWQGRR